MVFLGLCLIAGLNAQTRLAGPNDPNASAGAGQSEIIINAENADKDIVVWVNGVTVAHLRPKTREKIIVHNGQNVVEAADTTARGGTWNIGAKRSITVSSNATCTIVGMTMRYGALVSLNIQNTLAVGGGGAVTPAAAPPPPAAAAIAALPAAPAPAPAARAAPAPRAAAAPARRSSGNPLEDAVIRAAHTLIHNLPENTTVAVLSIASSDQDMADFIIEEIVFLFVDTRKFRVVDRKSLDAVRAEANFQYSGDVDDNSAVSIGKMLGANVVITGSVSGSGSTRRLRAKALNVQTAEIITMASESF